MEWQENYNVGVEVVDKAHRKLFSIVRKLTETVDVNDRGQKKRACIEGIKYFKNYTLEHFAQEEEYMRSIEYSGYPAHKKVHEELKNITLPALEEEMERQDYSDASISNFIGACVAWLTIHIMVEDQAITGRIASRVHHREIEADKILQLSNVISEVTEEVFDMEAALVSRYYSGGEIADPVCFVLEYGGDDEEELTQTVHEAKRVLMAFEKPFVFNATGGMIGIPFTEMNTIVERTMEQLMEANVRRVGMRMAEMDYISAATDSDVITMEKLKEIYIENPPRYSLLFRTEKGNFSFAMD